MNVQQTAVSIIGTKDSRAHAEGGDVEYGPDIDSERIIVSPADLKRLGHKSVDDFIRHELSSSQGAVAGYYSGVDAVTTLHVGLTEAGRESFRVARKSAIDAFYKESTEV